MWPAMDCRQLLYLSLCSIILSLLVSAKFCFYCDPTDSPNCVGIPMYCGQGEDCYQGQGIAKGISSIINKGCVERAHCGKEQPVDYFGVTYTLISYCCNGELCNANPPGPTQAKADIKVIIVSMALLLLLHWLF